MDERAIKRLLIILVASIIAIMLLKAGLTRTYTTINKVVAEKKQAEPVKTPAPLQASAVTAASEVIETPTASAVGEAAASEPPAASSVEQTP